MLFCQNQLMLKIMLAEFANANQVKCWKYLMDHPGQVVTPHNIYWKSMALAFTLLNIMMGYMPSPLT